jgi:nucleoporin NUP82
VSGSSRIAKIGWHPWNDGASSLLVLTSDGMFRCFIFFLIFPSFGTDVILCREYDVSRDAEEPQQLLSFVSPRTRGQYSVEDPSTREAVSFCIGQGNTDWSPLTVFALMKSGDVWAMSPFLPSNASVFYSFSHASDPWLIYTFAQSSLVPSEYVPALECFVAAKRELIEAGTSAFLSSHDLAPTTSIITDEDAIAITNDQQLKYVNALMKQLLKSGALESADKATISLPSSTPSRVNVRPPIIHKYPIARQGPFLLQPAPPELGSGDDDIENPAMDIVYLTIDEDDNGVEGDKEKLGVIGIVYQDGKVDICLDTDKVEAKWDLQPVGTDFLKVQIV